MLRPLLAALLTLTALTALTPNASAVAICSHQEDVQDLNLDDSWLVRQQCTTENLISYDCDTDLRVYADGTVARSLRCDPLIYCVTDPCPGPVATSSAAAAAPCGTVGSPVLDGGFGVACAYGPAECSAVTATYGTIDAFLSPDAGCSVSAGPCALGPQVDDGRVDRFLLECQGFIQCVMEPCPGSGTIKV